MHFSSIVISAIAGLSAIGTALPTTAEEAVADKASYEWTFHNFGVGCSPGGCSGSTYISGPKTSKAPAFNVTCSSTSYDTTYVTCSEGKHSDHIGFWWKFPKEGSTEQITVYAEYETHGKKKAGTWTAEKTIKNPGYEKVATFKAEPKFQDADE